MNHHPFFSWFQLTIATFGMIALFLVFFALVALIVARKKKSSKDIRIEVKCMNKSFEENKIKLLENILPDDEFKKWEKEIEDKKKQEKKLKKEKGNEASSEKPTRIFVLDFSGDVAASCLTSFREQITTLLQVAQPTDEVVVRLESPGGYVHAYGLASSQLARIRDKGIPLTICVDKVAASGGYMMACLANKIIAAPFAILGSIGVVANVPNFNRVLQKNQVDYFEMTAGEYKRTLTMLGEVTDKGKSKFQEQLEETHTLFKEHIKKFRPIVEIDIVATGEHWLGSKALELKLVDELKTSDDYLMSASEKHKIYLIYTPKKESLKDKLGGLAQALFLSAQLKQIEAQKQIPLLM